MEIEKLRETAIGLIYEASHHQEGWTALCDLLMQEMNSISGTITIQNPDSLKTNTRLFTGLPDAFHQEFLNKFYHHDVWVKWMYHNFGKGEFASTCLGFPKQVWQQSLIRNEFHIHWGVEYGLASYWSLENNNAFRISFLRGQTPGDYDFQHVNLMNSLSAHFNRAIQLGDWAGTLYDSNKLNNGLQQHIEQLDDHAAIIDMNGKLLEATAPFEHLLRRGTIARLCRGALNIKLNERFVPAFSLIQEHIFACSDDRIFGTTTYGYTFTGRIVRAKLKPFDYHQQSFILITVKAPEKSNSHKDGSVANFTPTEIHICELICKGYSSKQIAGERNKSSHTIRTQIRNLFKKAGVNSRAELVNYFLNNVH